VYLRGEGQSCRIIVIKQCSYAQWAYERSGGLFALKRFSNVEQLTYLALESPHRHT
jgi:hypothetical protein